VTPAFCNDAEGIELDHLNHQEHPMFGIIEEDRGTYTRSRHPHSGYYAGDFADTVGRSATAARPASVVRTTAHPTERVLG
jgi:hypothetical protein